MTLLTLFQIGCAGVTGLTVFARAELLRPRVRSAYLTNGLTRLLMDGVALTLVFVIFELIGGATLPDAITAFLAMCAIASTAMLISMCVHNSRVVVEKRAEEATRGTRQNDVADMKTAVAETLPGALNAAMPPVIKALAAQPDPYRPSSKTQI